MKLKIKKDDMVMVITGDDKGKTGRVLDVNKKDMRLLIEGINIHTRHEKPSQQNQDGGRIKKEFPIPYSNAMLIDKNGEPTRTSIRVVTKGKRTTKVRVARSTGDDI